MSSVPEVQFVETDGGFIGYQVFGSGPPDLWVGRAGIGHLELMWDHPQVAALLWRLADFARVIVVDPLGFGVSDPGEPSKVGRWEYTVDDMRAVLAAVGSDRGVLVGFGSASTGALFG
jgi:pimeloyl-ACP methyl ester carboxylesterase